MNSAILSWLTTILEKRFGHCFTLIQSEHTLRLNLPQATGAIVFDRLQAAFGQSRSDIDCCEWNAQSEGWHTSVGKPITAPAVSQLPRPLIEKSGHDSRIHYDILGLIYWMLTRLEEIGHKNLDEHDRFPALFSHAFRYGYLERPIVDEWLDILGQVIQRQWPTIVLKRHRFKMKISHDVDIPSRYGFLKFKSLIRSIGGDIILRADLINAVRAPWIWLNSKNAIHPLDPANTFDWLMDLSDKHNLTSAFYFMCGRTDPTKDAIYEIEHPAIRALLRKIHQRGHEIGLHPSYNTYQNPESIKTEAERLRKVCKEENIRQDSWGGRMHFLRWRQPTTLNAWEKAGMTYDSTLGYADRPGFRCGTCFEYPAFDPIEGKQLALRIRPLIAMDCSVISEHYLGFGSTEAAYEKFLQLKEACRAVNGQFTLLWHNSFFNSAKDFDIYQRLIETPK